MIIVTKFVLLIICIFLLLTLVCSFKEINTCPSFDYFGFFLRKQCPTIVSNDLKCVIGLPGDIRNSSYLNCRTGFFFNFLKLVFCFNFS